MLVRNRLLPLPGFTAINLFGIIFVRRDKPFTDTDLRHERIHTCQMRELLFLPFYILYVLEWLVRLAQTRHPLHAYFHISFEREAYAHQDDSNYLRNRPHYAWKRFL